MQQKKLVDWARSVAAPSTPATGNNQHSFYWDVRLKDVRGFTLRMAATSTPRRPYFELCINITGHPALKYRRITPELRLLYDDMKHKPTRIEILPSGYNTPASAKPSSCLWTSQDRRDSVSLARPQRL